MKIPGYRKIGNMHDLNPQNPILLTIRNFTSEDKYSSVRVECQADPWAVPNHRSKDFKLSILECYRIPCEIASRYFLAIFSAGSGREPLKRPTPYSM